MRVQLTVALFICAAFRLWNIDGKLNLCFFAGVDPDEVPSCCICRGVSVDVVLACTVGGVCVLCRRTVLSMRVMAPGFPFGAVSVAGSARSMDLAIDGKLLLKSGRPITAPSV